MTTSDYLTQLQQDRDDLVDNLTTKGITGLTGDETFTELVPEVLNIPSSGVPDWSQIGYSGVPQQLISDFNYAKNIYDNWVPQQILANQFFNNTQLTIMPLVDTSNATDMSSMFNYCRRLYLVPQLDTSNVTNMSLMFSDCASLPTIPILNTSNVTSMESMFKNCSVLTTIPLLNTSNVTNMRYMFSTCRLLTSIPQFDTSKVTNMESMFYYVQQLTTLPLLNTSNVTNMKDMFSNCTNLTNESLNNILKMCANATKIVSNKTLYYIFGRSNMSYYYPASTIQSLSNYQDFVDAGWSIGWS